MSVTLFDPGFDWTYAVVKIGEGEPPIFEVDLTFDSGELDLSVEGQWLAPGVAQATGQLFKHTYQFGYDLTGLDTEATIAASGLPSGEYILTITGSLNDGSTFELVNKFDEPNPADVINWILNQDFGVDAAVETTSDSFDFVDLLGTAGGVSGAAMNVAESFQKVAVAASGATFTPGEGDKVGLILDPISDAQTEVAELVDSMTLLVAPTTFSDDFIL